MDVNLVVKIKGEHNYIFIFDDSDAATTHALRTCGKWASDPELNFTWLDAGQICRKIRQVRDRVQKSLEAELRGATLRAVRFARRHRLNIIDEIESVTVGVAYTGPMVSVCLRFRRRIVTWTPVCRDEGVTQFVGRVE